MAAHNPSSLVADDVEVSTAAPLPTVSAAAVAPGTAVAISPRTFIVNGEPVSASNPLPITLA